MAGARAFGSGAERSVSNPRAAAGGDGRQEGTLPGRNPAAVPDGEAPCDSCSIGAFGSVASSLCPTLPARPSRGGAGPRCDGGGRPVLGWGSSVAWVWRRGSARWCKVRSPLDGGMRSVATRWPHWMPARRQRGGRSVTLWAKVRALPGLWRYTRSEVSGRGGGTRMGGHARRRHRRGSSRRKTPSAYSSQEGPGRQGPTARRRQPGRFSSWV